MYQPAAFRETRREAIEGLVQAYPFATVMTRAADGLAANHLPLQLAGGLLRGHVARGNELAGLDGAPVLAVFQGPQGYVSPSWYPSKHETGREVPTWNYAVAHVHGRLRVIDDAAWLRAFLATLTERHEAGEPRPWSIDDAPAGYVAGLLRAIVGIEIAIERVEGKFKLSQNHPVANRRGVIEGLRRRGQAGDAALAALMAQAQDKP